MPMQRAFVISALVALAAMALWWAAAEQVFLGVEGYGLPGCMGRC